MKSIVFLLVILGIVFNVQAQNCNPLSLIYRSHDGSCNNILFPSWGSANSYYANGPEGRERYTWAESPRLIPNPTYADAHLLPDDGPRGNARNISNTISQRLTAEVDPINHSMFAIQYGQFLCHDIDANQMEMDDTNLIDHPGQFPLVSYLKEFDNEPQCTAAGPNRCTDADPVLASIARRTAGYRDSAGNFKAGNSATSYFDLDTIYGRNEADNDKLRTKVGGKLLMRESATTTVAGQTFTFENILPDYTLTGLPVNPNLLTPATPPTHVFTGGDGRINENIALVMFHTIWAREHNRICEELLEENFLWRLAPAIFDEIIYQKARSITIAKYQHIIYTQYIPSNFGAPVADLLGDFSNYNPLVESTTHLSFASGAFRYGHFSFNNYYSVDECGNTTQYGLPSTEKLTFGGLTAPAPDFIQPLNVLAAASFENIARGLTNERAAPVNGRADEIIRNIFLPTGVVDLLALDIMRARYNQLPTYLKLRKTYYGADALTNGVYGLPGCPASLENNNSVDDPEACYLHITDDAEKADRLKDAYRKIKLIDPIMGIGLEKLIPNATVGRTAANIIVAQFKRSRDGDRFFYRNNMYSFSSRERNAILNTTIGEVLRRNLADGFDIPDNTFVVPDNFRDNLASTCQS